MSATRAERLDAVLRTLKAPDRVNGGAPYSIHTLPDGGRRVLVVSGDGDILAGSGATLDAAIAALERKTGLVKE